MSQQIYIGVINKLMTNDTSYQLIRYKNIINLIARYYGIELSGSYHFYVDSIEVNQCVIPCLPSQRKIITLFPDHSIDTWILANDLLIDETLLKSFDNNIIQQSIHHAIIQQIQWCNQMMHIVDNYQMVANKYDLCRLKTMITIVATNSTLNWTLASLFEKIDEFIIQDHLKKDNASYYLSLGTMVGIVNDTPNVADGTPNVADGTPNVADGTEATSCLQIMVNHRKKKYSVRPVARFSHGRHTPLFDVVQIYVRHLPNVQSFLCQCIYPWIHQEIYGNSPTTH